MPNTYRDDEHPSFAAGGTITQYQLVKLSAANTVVAAGAGEDSIGVALRGASSGDVIPVKLWNEDGTFPVVAAGTISAGSSVYAAASGQVSDTAAGTAIGYLNEAGTAGAVVEMVVANQLVLAASAAISDPAAAAALTYSDPAAITYSDPAALTSPAAGAGSGADATTFSGAECDAVVADITAIRTALIALGTDVPAVRTALVAAGVDLGAVRTATTANRTAIASIIDAEQAAGIVLT